MKYFSRIVIFCCVFLLLPALAANAKSNGRLAGSIKSLSGSPLQNAVIKILREVQDGETVLVTRSDRRGLFESARLIPGTYFLEVSRQGYQPITATKFTIDPGQTTSLDIILRDLIDYIDRDEDPRNWDLKSVLRSTSDRRLIFREFPDLPAVLAENEPLFSRGGAMNIASSNSPGGTAYLLHPQTSQTGVTTNFAFAEPVGPHSRMILSGQMDFGSGTFWRFRNTFNYRPDSSHDYRVSVGYGRLSVSHSETGTVASPILPDELEPRESGVRTLALGLEGSARLLDVLAIKYGFDYSRLTYGSSRGFVNPSFQVLITPAEGWNLRTSFASRRTNEDETVFLPDGEMLDLSESTLITLVGNQVSMSQIRHTEIAAEKEFGEKTSVEVAVYQDRIKGPGLPIMVTTITPLRQKSRVVQMDEDNASQRGTRLTVKRQIGDNLSGSVAYVYGESAGISGFSESLSSDTISSGLVEFLRQQYQHSITGSLRATFPLTGTTLLAVMRWYPDNPLTPVDWFSDRMDIGTKSANFEVRQTVPVPDIMGTDGQWDFWVDLRNILNQGRETLSASDGDVVFNRNPRSVRFGLSLSFR